MWIKITNPATKKIKTPSLDEPVEFNEDGVARVEKDVGERLIDELDSVQERKAEEDKEEDSFSVDEQGPSDIEESDEE